MADHEMFSEETRERSHELTLERIAKARVELLLTRTFYGVLVGQVVPVISEKIETMATNGKQHYANPKFIETLTQAELLGVQAHESEHDARRHHTRRGNRDPKKWNIACDYSINCDLLDEGFVLPEGALVDRKYKGMSAEDVYRSREIDDMLKQQEEEEKRKKEQEEKEEQEQDDADDQEGDEGDADEGDADEGDADEGDDESDSDADESESDSDAVESESNGDEAGDEAGETSDDEGSETAGSGDGTDAGEPNTEGAGAGDGEGDADLPGTPENAPGEAGNAAGEPVSHGDPGGCGEVLDAAPDTAELASEDAKWETVLRQAAMLASKRGTAPGHVSRELEHADHPPQDWRETLRAFFDQGCAVSETWNRPNRRFIGGGLYLPGRQRDGINRAVVLIDTSGSVTYYPGALEAIQTETQAALDEGFIDELVVVYGDTRVTRVDTYRSGDEIEFDPKGGGGTVMKPLFDYARDEVEASCIIAFTDMEIEHESMLGPEPSCPVLWAAVGYPDRVKRYLQNTPWNAAGIEVVPSYN